MPRTPARWSQAELDRLARAVEKTNGQVIVELIVACPDDPHGKLRFVPVDKQRLPADDTPRSVLEEWERKNGQG